MSKERKPCPICRKRRIKDARNKTCGKYECRGKYAEYKTKRRAERQKAAEPFLRKCAETAKEYTQDNEICVVCGEFLNVSLTTHHFNRRENPSDVITLCGSCHRTFDSSNAGVKELKVRRGRYLKYNLSCMHDSEI